MIMILLLPPLFYKFIAFAAVGIVDPERFAYPFGIRHQAFGIGPYLCFQNLNV